MIIFLQMNDSTSRGLGGIMLILLILVGAALYFLPTIIAFVRGRHNKIAIAALNFFLGWSLIGWVISLIWSLSSNIPNQVVINSPSPMQSEDEYDKLSKLKRLLDEGAISQEEFEIKKRSLLR